MKSATFLFPGDEIVVAPSNEGVKVTGNVLLTSEIPYRRGKVLYYLGAVGVLIIRMEEKSLHHLSQTRRLRIVFIHKIVSRSKSRISNCSSRKTR
jgi:hypothetical protein